MSVPAFTFTSSLPGSKECRSTPNVLVADPNWELRRLGRLWLSGLFDGEHSFSIEPLADGRVRIIRREQFKGLLVPFLSKMLDGDISRGFNG